MGKKKIPNFLFLPNECILKELTAIKEAVDILGITDASVLNAVKKRSVFKKKDY